MANDVVFMSLYIADVEQEKLHAFFAKVNGKIDTLRAADPDNAHDYQAPKAVHGTSCEIFACYVTRECYKAIAGDDDIGSYGAAISI